MKVEQRVFNRHVNPYVYELLLRRIKAIDGSLRDNEWVPFFSGRVTEAQYQRAIDSLIGSNGTQSILKVTQVREVAVSFVSDHFLSLRVLKSNQTAVHSNEIYIEDYMKRANPLRSKAHYQATAARQNHSVLTQLKYYDKNQLGMTSDGHELTPQDSMDEMLFYAQHFAEGEEATQFWTNFDRLSMVEKERLFHFFICFTQKRIKEFKGLEKRTIEQKEEEARKKKHLLLFGDVSEEEIHDAREEKRPGKERKRSRSAEVP